MLLPISSTLGVTFFAKRLIVLDKLIFCGHISLAAAIKHDLIISTLVNGLPNTWATEGTSYSHSLISFYIFMKEYKNIPLW